MEIDGIFEWKRLFSYVLGIYLLVASQISGVAGELCEYRRSVYNQFESSYDQMNTIRDCQWGCCKHYRDPCCPTPVGLIVGCILGGVLVFGLIVIAICCCCFCRKKNNERRRASVLRVGQRGDRSFATQQTSVIFHSETSGGIDIPADNSYDPPPSYEEVIRGETNHAFKDDSS